MLFEYKGKSPKIGKNVFIAPTAVVIGDVEIGDYSSVWYGAVIRADLASVRIGRYTNIQDNCSIHVDYDFPANIGDYVTVGHNAVVHGCTVEKNSLVGFNASVLNGATVKTGSVIAAGSLVKEGQSVGPNHLVAGAPAILKKELPDNMSEALELPARVYLELAESHKVHVKKLD